MGQKAAGCFPLMKSKELRRESQKVYKKQGSKYRDQSWPGVWRSADGNTAFVFRSSIRRTGKGSKSQSPVAPPRA